MKKKIIITILCLLLTTLISCKCLCSDLFHENGYFKLLPMTVEPRQGHTATLLQDGRVLITGGTFSGNRVANAEERYKSTTAEIYDPKTNKFMKTGNMTAPRFDHAAVLLNDGRVLITGGTIDGKHTLEDLKSAEIYDPETEKFTKINDMNHTWSDHNMILLNDGRVLLSHFGPNLEIFNPKTNEFKETAPCLTKKCPENATLLNDGTVLFASGYNIYFGIYYDPQIFDPRTETFKYTGKMNLSRAKSTATLLKNGEVIIIGGDAPPKSEIYNPSTGTFRLAGKLNQSRYEHGSILLNNSKVLVVEGTYGRFDMQKHIKFAELYNPKTDSFAKIGNIHYFRYQPTLTLLNNGNVLIMGDGKRPELYISK